MSVLEGPRREVRHVVKDGSAAVDAQIAADYPSVAWTMTPRVCFRATAHIAWSP